MKTNRSLLPLMGLGLLTGLIAGCAHERPAKADPFFPPHEQGVTASVLEAQAARGARTDATLYPAHFTTSTLNTLGQAKLALILTDRADTLPLTIYLDLPANDPQAAEAVRAYLTDAGLLASQFTLEAGPNPATLHPAAPALSKLPKTDNPQSQKTSSTPTPEPAAPLDFSDLTGLLGAQKH